MGMGKEQPETCMREEAQGGIGDEGMEDRDDYGSRDCRSDWNFDGLWES